MATGSITWNSTYLGTYGLRVTWPSDVMNRIADLFQLQDRAYAGKGQKGARIRTLPVIIEADSLTDLNTNYGILRGLLDKDEDCRLSFDGVSGLYWMARFGRLEGGYTSDRTWEGALEFVCYDTKAYHLTSDSATFTLTENISADYGGTVRAICYDDDFVYIAGVTTSRVRKLSKIDLSLVATGPDYGGDIFCLCCDDAADGFIYYGGDGGPGQYDMVKLDKATMAVEVRGPDYGGRIYGCCEYGNFVYSGGNGGAGQYDLSKLLKSDMTTEVRSADNGTVIWAVVCNSTHVFAGCELAIGTVRRHLITDMSFVDESDQYGEILCLAIDSTNVYCAGNSLTGLEEVWRITLADLTAETVSGALTGVQLGLAVDDDYIYVVGEGNVVYKLNKAFAAGESYIAKSEDYGGDLFAIALDTVNDWLFIGGATTQTVWKLDSRHLEHLAVSDISYLAYNDFNCICCDDTYVYVASLNDFIVYKLRKTDLAVVTRSQPYYSSVNGIAESGNYIYIGGNAAAANRKIWKLLKENLTLTLEAPAASAGNITCVCVSQDGLYVLWGINDGAGSVAYIASVDDLVVDATSAAYGGIIYDIKEDGSNCFLGGATTERIYKLHKTTLAFVAQSDVYGSIYCLAWDSTYIYCGGVPDTIMQVTKATMATNATSADLGGDRLGIEIDENGTYLYTVGVDKYLQVLLIADLSVVAKTNINPDSLSIYSSGLCSDGGNIYCGEWNSGTAQVHKYYKRVLWQRSDHEISVVTSGTSATNPQITAIFDGDHYSGFTIENQTTEEDFEWEGTALDTEVMIIDSELWYMTLEDVSAMGGQDGDFITLAPGTNTLYVEGFVGVMQFIWQDRNA